MTYGTLQKARNELIKRNYKLFCIILYGCGGVIFQTHFFRILGRKNVALLEDFKECGLVRIQKVGKNNIIVLKNAVFCYFRLSNKSVRLSKNRLMQSALVCEMLLRLYGNLDVEALEREVRCGNYVYFCPERSLQLLEVFYEHFSEIYTKDELSALAWALERHRLKTEYLKASEQGRKDKLPAVSIPYTDWLTLRNNGVFLRDADSHGKTLRLRIAVFASGKDAAQIAEVIRKAERSLSDTFGSMEIKYSFEIFSLAERSEATEAKIFQNHFIFPRKYRKRGFLP